MSTLMSKRSRTKRPRPSHFVSEVISSAPSNASPHSSSDTLDSRKSAEAAQKDEALLKSTMSLERVAHELLSQNVSLSDPRIQALRRKFEKAMPILYQISQDCAPSFTSSRTSLIIRNAETFLKRFPDTANSGVLRSQNSRGDVPPRTARSPSSGTQLSPGTNAEASVSISPPQTILAQPAGPNTRLSQSVAPGKPGPVPTSSMAIPSTAQPTSSTPSPSDLLRRPVSYPGTRMQYTPGVARPPVRYEATCTPSHVHEAVKHTTQHQKMVLFAVHELLWKRSSRHTRQPWYEAPIGLSPEELIGSQERLNDPRFQHQSSGGQFPRYSPRTRPPPSPAGTPYPYHGNRSVAVGKCHQRSSSKE